MNAKQMINDRTTWTAEKARQALPVMLLLAKTGKKLTYKELDQEIARHYDHTALKVVVSYGGVLRIIGNSINQLSKEWQEEIPPLTILIVSGNTGKPSDGVDPFLQRYVSKSIGERLTVNNRWAMIERATNAVHNYGRWDEVAAYFEMNAFDTITEHDPIVLETPPTRLGGESAEHLALKEYVAMHPELFSDLGQFGIGQLEYRLHSGDEVDVLFYNEEIAVAVEIKTASAPLGEITRGIFQCVKYRALLRAMYDLKGELVNVQSILVTPRQLPGQYIQALDRLNIPWKRVSRA